MFYVDGCKKENGVVVDRFEVALCNYIDAINIYRGNLNAVDSYGSKKWDYVCISDEAEIIADSDGYGY